MLPQRYRLTRRAELMAVLRHGALVRGGGLTVRALPTGRQGSRFAFVVSNKVSKHAVQRNRLRRQLRELVRSSLSDVAGGYDVVVTVQPGAAVRTTAALQNALESALRRVRLLPL